MPCNAFLLTVFWWAQAVETGAYKAAAQPWKTFLLANLAGEHFLS